jgi:hypothetical protein
MTAKEPTTLTAAVRAEVRLIPPGVEFTLREVERIADDLAILYPPLAEAKATLRCMLQRQRPDGLVFVAPGRYKWNKMAV